VILLESGVRSRERNDGGWGMGQRREGEMRDREVWKEERVRERRVRGGDSEW
jgi:hypothetical protein